MYHHSYFLPELARIEQDNFRSTLSEMVGHVVVPLDTHNVYSEGNMANISPTIMIQKHMTHRISREYEGKHVVNPSLP
jgi:hypothetical protein